MFLGLPRRAGLFWLLVVVAASATLAAAWATDNGSSVDLAAVVLFALATGAAERIQVRLGSSRPGGEMFYSISCAFLVAAILIFPLAWAASIAAMGLAVGALLRGRVQPQKMLFNMANLTLSVAAGRLVWQSAGVQLTQLASIPWVVAAVMTYFVLNTGLTAAMVSAILDLPTVLVWRRGHRNVLLANLALPAAGVPVAGLWLAYPWMLICLAVALLAVHRAMADRLKLETQTLESLFQLADILDARDKYTHGHSERVGRYAEQLAIQLGMPSDRAHLTFLAGRLHDIGKCAINNEVLLKPSSLDDQERTHMRRHPEVGSAMLAHFVQRSGGIRARTS